jgi:hypothetical protein
LPLEGNDGRLVEETQAMFPWAYLEIVGAGLALAGFLVLLLVLILSRHNAPHYWDE